ARDFQSNPQFLNDSANSWNSAPGRDDIPGPGLPFRMAMWPEARVKSVINSSLFKKSSPFSGEGYPPAPIQAERMMLSGLGAWLISDGVWDDPNTPTSLLQWQHRS